MSITRGEFLRSLGKSLPGMVASTGMATAAHALIRRVAQAAPHDEPALAPTGGEAPVPYLQKGPETGNAIALTFDDGPAPGVTERILDTLREHRIHATFFMIGEKVAAAPELARRVLDEGHELGHHTYTHRKLTELSDADVEEEIEKTDAIFMEMLGRRADWFRPPFGALRQDQAVRVRNRGMRVALWSLDSEDWRGSTTESPTQRVAHRVHPGAIVLCHDLSVTADSLSETLTRLREETEYNCFTLTKLFESAAGPN
jgi:peptidoglycan/xylan/chitin deacetylase (PgdA/CDA1 family)